MSAVTGSALKARIESLGLGVTVYRDGAPVNDAGKIAAAYPHVVVHDGIGEDFELHGDTTDPAAHDGVIELVQVDVYQLARRLTGGQQSVNVESYTLPEDVANGLRRSAGLSVRGNRVYGVIVTRVRRWPIADNVVRHTMDVTVRRDTGKA